MILVQTACLSHVPTLLDQGLYSSVAGNMADLVAVKSTWYTISSFSSLILSLSLSLVLSQSIFEIGNV